MAAKPMLRFECEFGCWVCDSKCIVKTFKALVWGRGCEVKCRVCETVYEVRRDGAYTVSLPPKGSVWMKAAQQRIGRQSQS